MHTISAHFIPLVARAPKLFINCVRERLFSHAVEHEPMKSLSASILEKIKLRDSRSPIEKGYDYLVAACNAKRCFQPVVSKDHNFKVFKPTPFPEIFDTCLILDLLSKRRLDPVIVQTGLRYIAENQRPDGLFSFFEDSSLLPQDVDDTSLAMLVLLDHQKVKKSDALQVADAIVKNVDERGIIQTYFPPRYGRDGRIDPAVCANAIRFLYKVGRGEACKPTVDHLYSYLENMKQKKDDLYYGKGIFFHFMWEALKTSSLLKERFQPLFRDRLIAQIGSTSTPIDLASRVSVLSEMGISNYMEMEKLYHLQQEDGSWPIDVAYTGSRKNLFWGSRAISTAFAFQALDDAQGMELRRKMQTLPILLNEFEVVSGKLRYKDTHSISSMTFKIIAVTHGETLAARNKRFYDSDSDSTNNTLTDKGKEDVQNVARRLQREVTANNIVLFHGENRRTLQTALIIQEVFSATELHCASWLNEINCANWYGNSTQEVLNVNFSAQAMFNDSDCLAKCVDGENFLEVLNRVYMGLSALQKGNFKNDTVIILCTSRVNMVALKVLLKDAIEYDSNGNIHWALMSRKVGSSAVFHIYTARR